MRRSLVLTDEMARHPFLASLAPHIRRVAGVQTLPRSGWMQNLREFLMAYCACFIAVSLYIA